MSLHSITLQLMARKLFCPWHGKVSTRTLRIHFSPGQIRASDPLYVVYVGPKLTKR